MILYNEIKHYRQAKTAPLHMVVEMATYGPEQTGLPVKVYVDDTKSYMRSGHNQSYRFKYQQDTNISNPRQWIPVTIPDLQIMNNGKLPPSVIQQRKVNLVLQWAKGNMNLLLQLRDDKINGEYFKENMKTLDEIKVIITSDLYEYATLCSSILKNNNHKVPTPMEDEEFEEFFKSYL